jgi:hypothetical protein
MNTLATNDTPQLLNSIIDLIDKTRHVVAKTVNQELTLLYWNIGRSINERWNIRLLQERINNTLF